MPELHFSSVHRLAIGVSALDACCIPHASRMSATAANPARIDKWLWSVRVFKTRALAAEACRAGSVLVGGLPAKPARELREGEALELRLGLVRRRLRFVAAPKGRVAAVQVPAYCIDETSPEEYEKAKVSRVQQLLARERGSGRPTKRERREIDAFLTQPAGEDSE
jgi:ribosome-associated heat shock protein Hsp15